MIAFSVTAAVLIVLLRQQRPEQGMLLSIFTAAALMFALLQNIHPLVSDLQQMLDRFTVDGEATSVLIKSMGVCFLGQMASDLCRDAGESTMANQIELTAKVAILLLALPFLEELLLLAASVMN